MKSKYNIPLRSLIEEFQLEPLYLPQGAEEILISSPEVDRPGFALSGYTDSFEPCRMQLIGLAEHRYLLGLDEEERKRHLNKFFSLKLTYRGDTLVGSEVKEY